MYKTVQSGIAPISQSFNPSEEKKAPGFCTGTRDFQLTKIGKVPKSWQVLSLGSIADHRAPIRYGVVQIGPYVPDGTPIVPIKYMKEISLSRLHLASPSIERRYHGSRIQGGDLLVSVKGTIGRVGVVPEGFHGNIAREIARIRPSQDFDVWFLAYQLESPQTQRRIANTIVGSTRLEFSIATLRDFMVAVPATIHEQRSIAAILRTWDEAIEKLNAMILRADRQLSAVRQHLFESVHRSRKGLDRARAIFETVSEKARPDLPLLAVMQDIGIVRRDELDRRVVMPDGETSGYKVVQPGDFVISLRSFEGGLELSNVLGLVSPAYTVLRTTRTISRDYFKHYFKSRSFVGRLDKMIFGIRDGKQIAFRDFGDMHIPCPSMEVQKAHAAILNAATETIETNRKLKTALEDQKRGLMQKLLTGRWRVKC
jgi:type I restriction enzyme, S subunit